MGFLIFLFSGVLCVEYIFEMQQACNQTAPTGCSTWTITGKFGLNTTGCFPEQTYVMTRDGIKDMKQLEIGDEILVYDRYTRQTTYSPVLAWLHRDTESKFEYEEIRHKSSRFYVSAKHNIGFLNNDSIEYDYSQYAVSRYMYSSSGNSLSVDSQATRILQGIYAPYTAIGNFYISSSGDTTDMVLVHCFAHVKNPYKYERIFYWSIKVCELLGINRQPVETSYRHPLSLLFYEMFPHLVDHGDHYKPYEHVSADEPEVDSTSTSSSSNYRRRKMKVLLFSAVNFLSNPILN